MIGLANQFWFFVFLVGRGGGKSGAPENWIEGTPLRTDPPGRQSGRHWSVSQEHEEDSSIGKEQRSVTSRQEWKQVGSGWNQGPGAQSGHKHTTRARSLQIKFSNFVDKSKKATHRHLRGGHILEVKHGTIKHKSRCVFV